MNVLFVTNPWIKTEPLHGRINRTGHCVRSTIVHAGKKVRENEVAWADYIIVMQEAHRKEIQKRFPQHSQNKYFVSLDIPEVYKYNPAQLIELADKRLRKYF